MSNMSGMQKSAANKLLHKTCAHERVNYNIDGGSCAPDTIYRIAGIIRGVIFS